MINLVIIKSLLKSFNQEGKCFGEICMGCLRHECEGEEGKKEFFKPDKKYMKKHLKGSARPQFT
jgi:hypothetical protein